MKKKQIQFSSIAFPTVTILASYGPYYVTSTDYPFIHQEGDRSSPWQLLQLRLIEVTPESAPNKMANVHVWKEKKTIPILKKENYQKSFDVTMTSLSRDNKDKKFKIWLQNMLLLFSSKILSLPTVLLHVRQMSLFLSYHLIMMSWQHQSIVLNNFC